MSMSGSEKLHLHYSITRSTINSYVPTQAIQVCQLRPEKAPEEEEVAGDSKVCLGQVLHLALVISWGSLSGGGLTCCLEVKAIHVRP